MILTLFLSSIMMVGLFLLLLAGVGFIQDKKFFTSAPKAVYEAVEEKPERFRGQHILGWSLALLAMFCMAGAVIVGAVDGIKNGFTFLQFYIRFALMMLLLKVFDIFFFDWFLLCRSTFFPHFYPEVKALLGPQLFGYNKKDHLIHVIAILVGSAVLAGLCVWVQ